MADRVQPHSTPPTSPRVSLVSPASPRPFPTFPLVPPAQHGTHPRHPTRHVPAAVDYPLPPATLDLVYAQGKGATKKVLLELADGSSFTGFSFGAEKSVSGELVFQTGALLPFNCGSIVSNTGDLV
jgi:carbamoyl-phosphate synthase / aspartate carbamoyltransferase